MLGMHFQDGHADHETRAGQIESLHEDVAERFSVSRLEPDI